MADSQIIDPDALERLREWGGDKLVGQMVRLFLKNSGRRMDQIRVGASAGPVTEAEQGAHSLKSSAANIGAQRVRTLTAEIEAAAVEDDTEAVARLLADLEPAFAAVIAELESIEQGIPDES
jgi:HPt (histidine-containing phosphotransfer) domain-containing protein